MYTQNLVLTRGSGTVSFTFDFNSTSPVVPINLSDGWLLRINYQNVMNLSKLSSAINGSNEQVELSNINNTVKVYLTESERNFIPDSGFDYRLYKYNPGTKLPDLMGYGLVVNSGAAPLGTTPKDIYSIDTPISIDVGGGFIDCLNANNFYTLLDEQNITSLFTFLNFSDGAVKSVKIEKPENMGATPLFQMIGITFVWAGGSQPVHPLGATIIYSFQRWGDYIYAVASDNF